MFLAKFLPRFQAVSHINTRLSVSLFHASPLLRGLDEFFENGYALPPVDFNRLPVVGRPWSAAELRGKSFDDLHKLWYVLLKELNMLYTQKAEAKRLNQRWPGAGRILKCRLSMARIKTILTERVELHEQSKELLEQSERGETITSGQLASQLQRGEVDKIIEGKRIVRERENHKKREHPLFR